MKPFRFVHAADLHLDSPFIGMAEVPAAVRNILRASTFAALDRLTELAVSVKADFVVLAGDVYDGAERSLRAQLRFQKAMERLAEHGISVFVVHGNHDPMDGHAARLVWPQSVHFFPAGEVERVPVVLQDGRGYVADVFGISYPTAAVRDNYARRFRREGEGPYAIGLLHANVEGEAEHADYAPCSLQDLAAAGMDYWALGHVHGRRVLGERPYVVYPGNLQGRSIRETGAKGCYVADVKESGETELAFHALDAVRWMRKRISIQGMSGEQELKERLERCLEEARLEAGGRPSVLRVELEGRGPLHRVLQRGAGLAELVDELRAAEAERAETGAAAGLAEDGFRLSAGPANFVWIESVQARTGREADLEGLRTADGFLGDLLRLSDELLGNRDELLRFTESCMEPLLTNPKAAGILLRGMPQARDGLPDPETAADWLRKAAEWAVDRLLEEEEGDA